MDHCLDGAFWPRSGEAGTPERPVVLLGVLHLAVVVVVPQLSLEELGQQPDHDPILTLLTLPVLPKPDIPGATKQILEPRPDLLVTVLSILGVRFPHLTRAEIMALINLPTDHMRLTRFGQECWRRAA